MNKVTKEIEEIINREIHAWNTKNVDLLLSIFHPDMVWVWPKNNLAHNPIDWELPLGKFEPKRWKSVYENMFDKNKIIKNERIIVDIKVSKERNGAFAVVDVDMIWENDKGECNHWFGRSGKTYTNVAGEWKLIAHHGLLKY